LKLFQIEEPDGAPADPDAPGVAVGIDLTRKWAAVAVSVGGNAVILEDREGLELDLTVPVPSATAERWQTLFEGVRLRAERALSQPVTHAVLCVPPQPTATFAALLMSTAEAAGLSILRLVPRDAVAAGEGPAMSVAEIAEDLAPRPAMP
jgi:hypothetical protein